MKYKIIASYIECCEYQKRLSTKTIKAYRIDLNQFYTYMKKRSIKDKKEISLYLQSLHIRFKPRTVKRKIASLKAFYAHLERQNIIKGNPFHKLDYHFKEPIELPKTIVLNELTKFVLSLYQYSAIYPNQKTIYRDIAVIELLICTGIRVSEITNLTKQNVMINENTLIISGKGKKERVLYIDNINLINSLKKYQQLYNEEIKQSSYFFINRLNHQLSEQSIRFMIYKYCHIFNITSHITPHMFRHTFATMMLEEDVDIRYIQEILGHSSITTTQIYTHMSTYKQKEIMSIKNPRHRIN